MKEICQRLPEFSNLTHLTIDRMEVFWSLIVYDEMIQLCPNLISLNVNPKAFYSLERRRIPTTLEILSTQPHRNMRTLRVDGISHLATVEYIMHKFPSLQDLELVSYDYPDFDLEGYFKDIDDRFIEYLNSMQKYEIRGIGSFSLLEAYLKHTPNVHIHFCYQQASILALHLKKRSIKRIAFTKFNNDSRKKERFLQMFKRYQHNITRFILDFDEYSEDRTAWIEDILATCTQMKAFHYWTYATFQPPSQGAIDANVPLNSTLETLTLRVHTIESGSLAGYLRLLPSVRYVNVKITCPSMNEVESRLDMLFDSFDTAPSNTWSPQSHYSSLTDVFGRKALLVIDDDFSDKTIYLVDIQRENRTTKKWTETVNENPLIKVFVDVNVYDDGVDYNNLYYDDLYE
ncbi:hypothetical protein RMCBS344292_12314 [Rhizopus microsporus]|nr:hypothetical protein RMCBS344292_12314 [Rhizopus microsporus]